MACADVAAAKAKITAMNLIILSSVVNLQEQIA
jgi:pyruvoyl-dependent arginine decarboxylase (PvlArgDC)